MIPSFWRELPEIVDGLSTAGRVRAIVLSAEGKHFCSGMDLTVFAGNDTLGGEGGRSGHRSRRNEAFRSMAMKLQDSFTALERARMPVLCAIQGACVGGGVDLVSAADLRYADDSAFFSIAEINIGMTADVGTLQRMPKLVPEGIVRELAYTGRRWTAAEAKAAGFVNAVFADHDALVAGVLDVAAEIATKSPMAVWGTKQALQFTRDHRVADGLEYIANWNAAMFDTDDMGEAFRAKTEKRAAEFPDLLTLSEGL
jgi:enoyl-CoA hydratase